MKNKVSFMIGISQKAGKVKSGEFATENAVKDGSACLLLLSEDASDNTKKKFTNMASWHNVPIRTILTKTELGRAAGKGERSCMAITDEGLASNMIRLIDET